ncbi:MAG TPA: CBS domain-containing protein [Candidatus Caldiarchaeum subterraneum]|uniref:CBS domain-containing protein n=1 Tax=Caldiarchaeum subterraneum TaxID=311458 RepID=A0A832ZWP1_CALS0|nr:CBS domain-containing protein [Aigarchaeota archaeon]HIQ30265.1 CBS domain-containing protein [Candidatus Caldarchaeum subterraneum]
MVEKMPKVVGEIMSSPVVTAKPQASVREVLELMEGKYIGAVIIVSEDGRPVGILTERDIIRLFLVKGDKILNSPVSEVMSKPLVTCSPKTPIAEALRVMHTNNIRRLPVVDGDKLVGIVTQRDITYWTLTLIGYQALRISELKEAEENLE